MSSAPLAIGMKVWRGYRANSAINQIPRQKGGHKQDGMREILLVAARERKSRDGARRGSGRYPSPQGSRGGIGTGISGGAGGRSAGLKHEKNCIRASTNKRDKQHKMRLFFFECFERRVYALQNGILRGPRERP